MHAALDRLTDDEVGEILTLLHEIEVRRGDDATLRRLANDSTFRVPPPSRRDFRPFKPISALGRPASATLIEDRR